jgi:hypothetical protein
VHRIYDTVNEQRDRWPEKLTGLEAWKLGQETTCIGHRALANQSEPVLNAARQISLASAPGFARFPKRHCQSAMTGQVTGDGVTLSVGHWTLFGVYTREQRSTGEFSKDMTGDR